MNSKTKIAMAVLLTFSATCVLFVYIFNTFGISVGRGNFRRLEAVGRIIEDRYIGEFDLQKAEDAAINAILSTIDDPYSQYYDEDGTLSLLTSIDGNYVGVGIEIASNIQTGEIVVLTVYKGGPAHRAGLMSGDVILAVDGVSYDGSSMDEAVSYMKGQGIDDPLGRELVITVRRVDETLELRMPREEIDMYYIEQKELADGLVYIQYTGFSRDSARNLQNIIESLDESTTGIILDLRENPGGDLDAAVEVCDLFLDGGMIMYTEDKEGKREERYASAGGCDLPLAILVDGGTASASEIVAGCMQARNRAVIIGEKTYGKGVSQMICSLGPDYTGGILKVTGYKNYRPDGIWINEAITPDIEVENNISIDEYGNITFDAQGDEPLNRAVEELKK